MVPFVLTRLIRDFTRGQIAWGVISALLSFRSHLSVAFRRAILRIALVTQLRAVLQLESLTSISCHSFRSLRWSCRKWSKPEGPLFKSEHEFACCKPVCWGNKCCEVTSRSLNVLSRISLESRLSSVRSQASKQVPVCVCFNAGRIVRSTNLIQYVEED